MYQILGLTQQSQILISSHSDPLMFYVEQIYDTISGGFRSDFMFFDKIRHSKNGNVFCMLPPLRRIVRPFVTFSDKN